MSKLIVRVPYNQDDRKKCWRKVLTHVDTSKANGYAFEGDWVKAGSLVELPVGAWLLCYDEPGSMKNWYTCIRVFRIIDKAEDNHLEEVYRRDGAFRDGSWALANRDAIAALVNVTPEPVEEPVPALDLSSVSTDVLLAEVRRREASRG